MIRRLTYRIFAVGALIVLGLVISNSSIQAQSRTLTKNISQTFHLEKRSTIELTNKYGQVVVDTWDKDSVSVDVKITAYGKNDEALTKNMERVDIDFKNFGDLLSIETVLDRNSSVFKEIMNSLGDYSKTLISKNKISIDFELKIPNKSSLKLDNKFGDVYIQDITQEATITVAHGDFKAQELTGACRLNLSFGKAWIKKLDKAFIELKGAEFDLKEGGDIDLTSSSSTFEVSSVKSLKVDSRNDKIQLDHVVAIRGYSSFSNIMVDSMLDRIDMELNYGDLMINSINSNFSSVNLKSKTADVNISLDMGSYFSAVLTGREDRMFLTRNFMGMNKTHDVENNKIITLTGKVGMIKPKESQLRIEGESGEITVYLEDGGGITNKN